MKRTHVVLIVVICTLLLLFGYFVLFESGRHETQVDITCGRVRHIDDSWLLRREGDPEETPISKLYRQLVGPPPEPMWRPAFGTRDGIFTGIIYDCVHGSSISPSQQLAMILLMHNELDNDAKRRIIITFFDLLQKDDDPARATQYVESFYGLDHIDGKHLPDPPEKIKQLDEREVQP